MDAAKTANKSMDMIRPDSEGNPDTGLPEYDDEILRQLNQMTTDIINEDKAANLYLLQ